MILTCHLQAGLPGAADTVASVSGDVLTVDGVAYDLSAVPEGGQAEPSGAHPFVGAITRQGGAIHATLRWQYDAAAAAPIQPASPPLVDVASGAVADPVTRPEPEPGP